MEEVFYSEGGEALEQVTQKCGGSPIAGDDGSRSGWWEALSTLIELWVSLFIAGELDQMIFKGPFQLN